MSALRALVLVATVSLPLVAAAQESTPKASVGPATVQYAELVEIIQDFSKLTRPLHDLTKKNILFV